MELMYSDYEYDYFTGLYGRKYSPLDNKRVTLKGLGNKEKGKELVVEQLRDGEYVLHLKERLKKFYDELVFGSLKNMNKDKREQLITEITETYRRLIDIVKLDNVNRITLPSEVIQTIPASQDQVLLQGNGNTVSIIVDYDNYNKLFQKEMAERNNKIR